MGRTAGKSWREDVKINVNLARASEWSIVNFNGSLLTIYFIGRLFKHRYHLLSETPLRTKNKFTHFYKKSLRSLRLKSMHNSRCLKNLSMIFIGRLFKHCYHLLSETPLRTKNNSLILQKIFAIFVFKIDAQ